MKSAPSKKTREKAVRETVIERYLVRELKKVGVRADKYKTPARRNAPDRICFPGMGQTFFVECKRPGEKPRPGQLREFKRLADLGFVVYVIDNRDWVSFLCRMLAAERRSPL